MSKDKNPSKHSLQQPSSKKEHEIKVPVLPESVADAVVISWYKQPGEYVEQDEPIVDIETDKVVLEVPAPVSGILEKIVESDGSTVLAQQVLGILIKQEAGKAQAQAQEPNTADDEETQRIITPAAQKMIIENKLNADLIIGSGKNSRVLKEDVLNFIENSAKESDSSSPSPELNQPSHEAEKNETPLSSQTDNIFREEKRVPMTRLRSRIAQRLLEAQQNAAILTTFNEVNMQPVMELRSRYKELFEKTHEVKLGFMSFFVKAAVDALKQYPAVNASIDGNDIVYHGYFDIGVAVSSPRGLVVPVLKNSETMTMADIENNIRNLAIKARDNSLSLDDITGGTFSITNGGVFGSLLSTPILNPPQSAILGMHKIQDRPVVENGEIVIRPIMYLALSYDHRIIDGREAVQFLVAIKNSLEDPARMLLDI